MIAQKNIPLELGSNIPMLDELIVDVSDEKMTLNNNFNDNGLLVIFSCNTCPFVVMWENRYKQLEKISNAEENSNLLKALKSSGNNLSFEPM